MSLRGVRIIILFFSSLGTEYDTDTEVVDD